ncbi:hypothetical protein SDRG_01019 [Saprolegnia diclina VS20]|uniref:Bromo domain-containing protein n=1 Tax=Saprolegnia diclina (strain VS20) TaxID=1156394 RepID=T0R6V3_SAPDV|nr:hypothetical protein SDRG_01019 [Saprolegnia diclina VS20]EQC42180.1 hypothetical protein SDRG_01019 [Saprolegnia diclina VS20]|eukprot:XP_008604749.1 hypothetical protein SDRG_01019 [Saprolegnia diclina VS20]
MTPSTKPEVTSTDAASRSYMIGSAGGAQLQDILRTAAQPEEAIVSFQKQHGLKEDTAASLQLLDLLGCRRSETHRSLLDALLQTLLARIQHKHTSEAQLLKLLETTFPYLEYKELRCIPIAIMAAQSSTPSLYLKEMCDPDHRHLLEHLPMHVKRRLWSIAPHELRLEMDKVVGQYLDHKRSLLLEASSPFDLHAHHALSPEDRRKQDPVLATLVNMIGDSAELYLQCVDILRSIIASGVLPGHTSSLESPKEYTYLASLLGTLRSDMANVQRDHATTLVRTDPLHKFLWFLDHAVKTNHMDAAQLLEMLLVLRKLRLRDAKPSATAIASAPPPPKETLLKLIDQMTKSDSRRIFADPVPDDVPNYHTIIASPMDLSTLRQNVHAALYSSLASFAKDVNLIWTNCMTFNEEGTIYHREAKRLEKLSAGWIDKARVALEAEKAPPCLLATAGALSAKDANDTERSGMVFEGECDPLLADVAIVLSDPIVKRLLHHVLWLQLRSVSARHIFPTDDVVCRGLVQLLHVGNIGSVRRMVRKQDYLLRSPPVLVLRLCLPLMLRAQLSSAHMPHQTLALFDESWSTVWANGTCLKALGRQFFLTLLHDGALSAAHALLKTTETATEKDEAWTRDLVFLSSVVHALLLPKHLKNKEGHWKTLVHSLFETLWLPAVRLEQGKAYMDADDVVVLPLLPLHAQMARLLVAVADDKESTMIAFATAALHGLTSETVPLAVVAASATFASLRPFYRKLQLKHPELAKDVTFDDDV